MAEIMRAQVMHWLCKPRPGFRTHHLHLVPIGSQLWKDRIAFRDRLRSSSVLADAYASLKRDLARMHGNDREAYTAAKQPFVMMHVRMARPGGHRRIVLMAMMLVVRAVPRSRSARTSTRLTPWLANPRSAAAAIAGIRVRLLSGWRCSCVRCLLAPGVERVVHDHPVREHLVVVGEVARQAE